MKTLILNAETANLSIEHLLKEASEGGLELRDGLGNIVAIVVSPSDREALTYAEAKLDLDQHRDQVRRALARRGGITTSELLSKAAFAEKKAAQQ